MSDNVREKTGARCWESPLFEVLPDVLEDLCYCALIAVRPNVSSFQKSVLASVAFDVSVYHFGAKDWRSWSVVPRHSALHSGAIRWRT